MKLSSGGPGVTWSAGCWGTMPGTCSDSITCATLQAESTNRQPRHAREEQAGLHRAGIRYSQACSILYSTEGINQDERYLEHGNVRAESSCTAAASGRTGELRAAKYLFTPRACDQDGTRIVAECSVRRERCVDTSVVAGMAAPICCRVRTSLPTLTPLHSQCRLTS